jgi:DNA mismatch endonuclease, patch repair protein
MKAFSLTLPVHHGVVYRAIGHMPLVSRSRNGAPSVDPLASARMRAVRQKNTAVEIAVRRFLHHHGLRFRVCPTDLPGRPDIANHRRRWAVFVHGCFWHGHLGCRLARAPKTNVEFWSEKIAGNGARDARKEIALRQAGFDVFVVWQCEVEDQQRLTTVFAALFPPSHRPQRRRAQALDDP